MSLPAGAYAGLSTEAGVLYVPQGRTGTPILVPRGAVTPPPPDPDPDPDPVDPTPDPAGNGRYTGPMPARGSILPFLQQATAPGFGRDVIVPHGVYTAASFETTRSGWVNLIAEKGHGSVRVEGVTRLDGELGIRFIGFDEIGQWSVQQNVSYRGRDARLRWWYGNHRNPGRLGYAGYDKQPAVFQFHSSAQELGIAGADVRESAQDLVKLTSAKKVLLQGILFVDTKWDWAPDEAYHSDAFQITGAATAIVLDSYFPEDARIQIGQENSHPARTYWNRVWSQGVPSFALTAGDKGQPTGPFTHFGDQVYFAPKTGWVGGADSLWRWANKYGTINGPVTSGTIRTAVPAGYDASPTRPARLVASSPEKRWRLANPYSSWRTYYASPASSFAGAEGASFFS